jgi:N-methylhydantoinase A/oxoprolinase/acetone carboxylase beta subunit
LRMRLGLGIDTGGTYTDAVIFDFDSCEVIAKAKALTTHAKLSDGIDKAISAMPATLLGQVELASVSTTLATNAIVEGRGGSTALILIGYDPGVLAKYGWDQELPMTELFMVKGGHDIKGERIEQLDLSEIGRVVEAIRDRFDCVAVSELAGVRNPEYELEVKEIIRSATGLPVVCGHELTRDLDSIKRAATSALNARLIPLIEDMVASVRSVLAGHGIEAPLMFVKGDGSLLSDRAVLTRPIDTVFSGPAASVAGGSYLSGVTEGVVVDMGGTTTDIATLQGGRPSVSPSGALVGDWRTSVPAVDMRTLGLGGDSHIRATRRGIEIGPRRVVPLGVAAATYRNMVNDLRSICESGSDSFLFQATDFFAKSGRVSRLQLVPSEREILDAFDGDEALSGIELARRTNTCHPSLLYTRRLEQVGVLQRIGLTPTDLLLVRGFELGWQPEASVIACQAVANQLDMGVEEFVDAALLKMRLELAQQITAKCIADELGVNGIRSDQLFGYVTRKAFEDTSDKSLLRVSLSLTSPVVAIGAPVQAFLSDFGQCFDTNVVIPKHFEVANAVGAVTGSIMCQSEVIVQPLIEGTVLVGYIVYSPQERVVVKEYDRAIELAVEQAREHAYRDAVSQGVSNPEISVQKAEASGTTAKGEGHGILLEVRVIASALGRPDYR